MALVRRGALLFFSTWAIFVWLVALWSCEEPLIEDPGPPGFDAGFEVEPPEPPLLTPCPAGWVERTGEDLQNTPATCEPWPEEGNPTSFGHCPEGWRSVRDTQTGTFSCDPWPEGGSLSCAGDEAHFLGTPGCSRIGEVCPAGDWAEGLPEGETILFVRPGGGLGGVGTRESPFESIGEALAVASEGSIVALSKGTFDEAVELEGGVTLWGACVAETIVTCSVESARQGTITGGGRGEARLRNLQLSGNRPAIVVSRSMLSIVLEDVVIQGARGWGLLINRQGSVVGRRVMLRETRRLSGGSGGHGVNLAEAGFVELSQAVIEGNFEAGLIVNGEGSRVVLTDVVVRDTQIGASGLLGRGLEVQNRARAEVNRSTFEGNRFDGIYVVSQGSFLSLTDVVISDTRNTNEAPSGAGLSVIDRAEAEVTRTVFERNQPISVVAYLEGTVLGLSDVIIRDSRASNDGSFGRGLHVQDGAHVELSRAAVERNREVAIALRNGSASLEDVVVRDTFNQDRDGLYGRGLNVEGGTVDLTRALFEGNHHTGIYVAGPSSGIDMMDVVVRDTLTTRGGSHGEGLVVAHGASGEAERVFFEGNRSVAISIADGARFNMTDAVLRDTQSAQGFLGRGLSVQGVSIALVTRALFDRNREVGVFASDAGTTLDMIDVVIRRTLERECASSFCEGAGGGLGVSVIGEAQVTMERFLVSENSLCGLQLAIGGTYDDGGEPIAYEGGGTADLHEGEVSSNRLCGVNVQTAGYDLRRLQDRVIYRENTRNLEMAELPIPDLGLADEH